MFVTARFLPEEPVPGVPASQAARPLTLAYVVEAAMEEGRFRSLAEVAASPGLSRVRLSQVRRRRWEPVGVQQLVLSNANGGSP